MFNYNNAAMNEFVSWDVFVNGRYVDQILFDRKMNSVLVLESLINEMRFPENLTTVKISQPFLHQPSKHSYLEDSSITII